VGCAKEEAKLRFFLRFSKYFGSFGEKIFFETVEKKRKMGRSGGKDGVMVDLPIFQYRIRRRELNMLRELVFRIAILWVKYYVKIRRPLSLIFFRLIIPHKPLTVN
jgi:hypothetical protein